MCFNAVVINPYRVSLNNLIIPMINNAILNKDGYFLMTENRYIRTCSPGKFILALIDELRRPAEYVHVHMRLATSGSRSTNNVHGWKVGKYFVSHNGFVSEFTTYRYLLHRHIHQYIKVEYSEFSDTYQLVHSERFKELVTSKDWEKLIDYLDDVGFSGVLMMNTKDFSEVIVISLNKNAYLHIGEYTLVSNERIFNNCEVLRDGVYLIRYGGFDTLYKVSKVTRSSIDDVTWFSFEDLYF